MHRKTAFTLALVSLAAMPLLASAQLTGNVALTSNYKFRGQDQDTGRTRAFKPAIQGGFDYAFGESGFYVGNWNSSVNFIGGNSIESDIYGGYKFKAGPFDLDVGALTYVYPGNRAPNTTELYGAATLADEAIGAFTLKYSHTVSKDYFNFAGEDSGSGLKGRNTGYVNLSYAKEIVPKLTLKAAAGYTRFASDITAPNYVDYAVGVAYDFGSGLALYGGVQGANKKAFYGDVNKARAIVTLSKTL
ncbi:MAG: TorF family putative porin [Variovorax sp.]